MQTGWFFLLPIKGELGSPSGRVRTEQKRFGYDVCHRGHRQTSVLLGIKAAQSLCHIEV